MFSPKYHEDIPRYASPNPQIRLSLKDKADLAILSSAIRGGSDVFITGYREILDLKIIANLEILSPPHSLTGEGKGGGESNEISIPLPSIPNASFSSVPRREKRLTKAAIWTSWWFVLFKAAGGPWW
jgi:hypothetical protein